LYEGKFIMALSTASGPWRSLAGYITPITYVTAANVVDGKFAIDAGANVVILAPIAGGPTTEVTLTLPLVETTDGKVFNITNAKPEFNGIKGSVLNYGNVAHVLAGYEISTGVFQPVNQDADGVVIPAGYGVQWGGNGNPEFPWAAVDSILSTGNS
jgi:hypothetical protein